MRGDHGPSPTVTVPADSATRSPRAESRPRCHTVVSRLGGRRNTVGSSPQSGGVGGGPGGAVDGGGAGGAGAGSSIWILSKLRYPSRSSRPDIRASGILSWRLHF